jgi:hypothetical protein
MNSNPTGQTQLSVRLDEIEAREKRKQEVNPPGRVCTCTDCNSSREKVALVKALRRAQHWFDIIENMDAPGKGAFGEKIEATTEYFYAKRAKSDITAILTNSSTAPSVPEQELGE